MTPLTTVAAVINAERIKLTTVQSPLWSTAAVVVLSLGIAVLQAAAAYDPDRLSAPAAAMGVAVFGVPVLMVVAAMTVTGEYRTGMVRTTFLASPGRTLVLVAKAVVAAVFSGSVGAVMVLGSILVAGVDLDAAAWRTTAAVGVYAASAAVLGVGVAVLLRHTAGAVTVLLLWPLLVEPLLGNLPGRGPQIGPYLPFANVFEFLDVQWLFPSYAMHWGPAASLGYFLTVVAAVFVTAVVAVNRRDA